METEELKKKLIKIRTGIYYKNLRVTFNTKEIRTDIYKFFEELDKIILPQIYDIQFIDGLNDVVAKIIIKQTIKEQGEKRCDNFRCPVCNGLDTVQYTKTDNKCNYCRTIFDINKT